MNGKISMLIFILLPTGITFQTHMDNNGFEIIVKNSKSVSNFGGLKYSPYHIYNFSQDLKKVRIRIRVKSNSNKLKKFDPNKLYLVSDEFKHRVRPIDLQYSFYLNSSFGLNRLTSDSTLSDGMSEKWLADVSYIRFDPKIKDTFKDYTIIGYQDVEYEVNYGSSKKPQNVVIYFEPIEVISYVFDVYFIVPKSMTGGDFYFGNKEIKHCNFDQ